MKKSNIVLIGFMGSGKTSVGKMLSQMLKMRFIDTDAEIERVCGKRVFKIFESYGEKYFRRVEKEVVARLLTVKNCVIATGGGIVENQEIFDILKRVGEVVYLKVSFENAERRVKKEGGVRPLFHDREEAKKRFLKREVLYQKVSDISVDTDGKNIEEVCLEVIKKANFELKVRERFFKMDGS